MNGFENDYVLSEFARLKREDMLREREIDRRAKASQKPASNRFEGILKVFTLRQHEDAKRDEISAPRLSHDESAMGNA